MLAVIQKFFADPRTLTLFALILIDLVTGVMVALITRKFDFQRVADFFRSKVVPYILGYLLYYLLTELGLAQYVGAVFADLIQYAGLGVAAANLIADITSNLMELRPPPSGPSVVVVEKTEAIVTPVGGSQP